MEIKDIDRDNWNGMENEKKIIILYCSLNLHKTVLQIFLSSMGTRRVYCDSKSSRFQLKLKKNFKFP
jgi:uncharacterized membrane protein